MTTTRTGLLALVTIAGALACGQDETNPFDSGTGGGADSSAGPAPSSTTVAADGSGTTSADSSGGGGPSLDVGFREDMAHGPAACTMETPADIDPRGAVPCNDQAPPNAFDAEVQWSWDGGESYHTPLVINLTDDNGNGEIDVCDIPDVILHVGTAFGAIHILDGATGVEHFSLPGMFDPNTTPAVGDIDDDGLPEIVASAGLPFAATMVAFEHDGTPKWTSTAPFSAMAGTAIGIANLDNQGPAEVYVAGVVVAGDTGATLFTAGAQAGLLAGALTAPTAADLDGDGTLEFIRGQDAYHPDGTVWYDDDTIAPGFPQVANFDDDDDPEILVISTEGITVLEHDGTVKYANARPSGDPSGFSWFRPATVHDFDGDGVSEFAVSSASHYAAYHRDASVMWIANVQDPSGVAAGTAFDFLGDGTAEAMFADEYHLFAFDIDGNASLQVDRSSGTLIEYPVVADVDNDGAAEILVVSNKNFENQQLTPTLQVIRDSQDRWIQARRIWNQHTYHVTNVNEDGTIPDFEPPSWRLLNTFRTNAQIEGGTVCIPPAG
ncbi:MAG: VCBS repeat-containing protein [Deltaproteobacteria bacterium]|nr:VCBS repeat-containing protein [Deltaproteobacteria bacterium]MBK8715569.1 VCBS repeat-containing protein [Deltaproteobacteria bacterium]MBP7287172.1 VCBS repeat-containing protein [Nannocystaceae bacterium]